MEYCVIVTNNRPPLISQIIKKKTQIRSIEAKLFKRKKNMDDKWMKSRNLYIFMSFYDRPTDLVTEMRPELCHSRCSDTHKI